MYVLERNKDNTINWKEEQIQTIIHLYCNEDKSPYKIAELFGTSPQTIRNLLRRNNIDIHEIGYYNRKFSLNEIFFEEIDTEEKAYWLGFLYADAYISETKHKIRLNLQSEDVNHLYKFRETLSTEKPIKVTTKKNGNKVYYLNYIELSSKKMVNDLKNKGCFQNKSLLLKFPNNDIVPENLKSHFIRGYFDGDGSLHVSRVYKPTGYKFYRISFVGTERFLKDLKKHLKCERLKLENKKTHFVLQINGNRQIREILSNIIYKDATIFLERKYNKYLEFMNYYECMD